MTLICNEHDMQRLLAEIGSDCLNEHDLTRIAELIPNDIRKKVWGDEADVSPLAQFDKRLALYRGELQFKLKISFYGAGLEVNTFGDGGVPTLSDALKRADLFINDVLARERSKADGLLSKVLVKKAQLKEEIAALEAEEERLRTGYSELR